MIGLSLINCREKYKNLKEKLSRIEDSLKIDGNLNTRKQIENINKHYPFKNRNLCGEEEVEIKPPSRQQEEAKNLLNDLYKRMDEHLKIKRELVPLNNIALIHN